MTTANSAVTRQKVETVWVMLKKVEWRIRASRCFSGVLQYRSSAGEFCGEGRDDSGR